MSQGDPRVDELLRPLFLGALADDAKTAAWNRAYENVLAALRGMDAERASFARQIAAAERFAKGQRESFERTRPLCSDHVDKQTGKQCLACLREVAERRAQATEAKLAEAERALKTGLEVESLVREELENVKRERDFLRGQGPVPDQTWQEELDAALAAKAAAESREKALREALVIYAPSAKALGFEAADLQRYRAGQGACPGIRVGARDYSGCGGGVDCPVCLGAALAAGKETDRG